MQVPTDWRWVARSRQVAGARQLVFGSQWVLQPVPFRTLLSDAHIDRALSAAKNPQLKMKLENMPVPLNADMIDEYMGPIFKAARDGDLSYIRTVA